MTGSTGKTGAATGVCTLVAHIRARAGCEDRVAAALAKVAETVARTEARTLGYHVGRAADDPALFVTFERFADRAAMDAHNGSAAVAAFVAEVDGCLDGPVGITVLDECSALVRSATQGDR